eukprot:jgi/Mesvir1/15129/Mv25497-RA.1
MRIARRPCEASSKPQSGVPGYRSKASMRFYRFGTGIRTSKVAGSRCCVSTKCCDRCLS